MTPADARAARSGLLAHRSNPRPDRDYLVMLDGTLLRNQCRVRLAYVPDKLLLEPAAFQAYVKAADGDAATSPLEPLALDMLDDINNEIVPRWVQILLVRQAAAPGMGSQRVIVEDSQPNWDNRSILAPLPAALSADPDAGEG